MAAPVICPGCQKPVRVPAEFRLAWTTCPHCQALVPNLSLEGNTAPPPRRPSADVEYACPRCGKRAEPHWLFCPHCDEPLREDRPRRAAGAPDVRRGAPPAGGRAALAVLGGLASLLALAVTGGAMVETGEFVPFAVVVVGLLFLTALSAGVLLLRDKGDLRARGPGRVVLAALTLAGALVAVGLLVAVALVVFLIAVYLAGSRGW
jgi:hypothetical protein